MNLTNAQSKKVEELINEYLNRDTKLITFQAPTGSGKTFMIANFISKIFKNNSFTKDKKIMFIIATLSDAKLPEIFMNKLQEYKNHLNYNEFDVSAYSNGTGIKGENVNNEISFKNKSVLIFGTSIFGKNRIINETEVFSNFIEKINKLKLSEEIEIIYIRDEAHKGTHISNGSQLTIDVLIKQIADFTVHMTATPKSNEKIISLTNLDLEEDYKDRIFLLKKEPVYINNFINLDDDSSKFNILKEAIGEFKKIKQSYRENRIFVNPAMLIQVSSKTQKNEKQFESDIKKITQIISSENLTYLKYFSGEQIEKNLKEPGDLIEASKPDSLFDVIIFKVGPATGWDIPRACMLVQLRSVASESLNIQTLGRIKRNPNRDLMFHPVTNKYYVFSNFREKNNVLDSYKYKEKYETKSFFRGIIFDNSERELMLDVYINYVSKIILNRRDFIEKYHYYKHISWLERRTNFYTTENKHNKIKSIDYIKNQIELKLFVFEMMRKNYVLFSKKVVEEIKKICLERRISFDLMIYIFIKEYKTELVKFYNETYYKNIKNTSHKIETGIKTNDYLKINSNSNPDNNSENKCCYEFIKKFDESDFDLASEQKLKFINNVIELINKKEHKYHKKHGSFSNMEFFWKWSDYHSGVYFEYRVNDEISNKKSYVDFIIKDKDGMTFMISVRCFDYLKKDSEEDLHNAYKNYSNTIRNENAKIKLLIVYFSDNKKSVIYDFDSNSYHKKTIENFLSEVYKLEKV